LYGLSDRPEDDSITGSLGQYKHIDELWRLRERNWPHEMVMWQFAQSRMNSVPLTGPRMKVQFWHRSIVSWFE